MLANECLELADDLGMPTEREIGLEPELEGAHPQLLEPGDLLCANGSSATSASGGPRQSASASRRSSDARVRSRARCLAHEPFEAEQVELVGPDAQHYPGWLRDDRVGAERLPQLRHVVLQRVGARSAAAPPARARR